MATSPPLDAAGADAGAPTQTSLMQFPETQSLGFTHAPPFGTRVLVAVGVAVAVFVAVAVPVAVAVAVAVAVLVLVPVLVAVRVPQNPDPKSFSTHAFPVHSLVIPRQLETAAKQVFWAAPTWPHNSLQREQSTRAGMSRHTSTVAFSQTQHTPCAIVAGIMTPRIAPRKIECSALSITPEHLDIVAPPTVRGFADSRSTVKLGSDEERPRSGGVGCGGFGQKACAAS
jgi:hypothetical protein